MKIDVMGLKFDSMTMDEALSRAEALLRGDKAAYVVTPNAEIAYEALHDVQLREMLNGADLMLPDGAGVVLASKLLRTPVKQKVAGRREKQLLFGFTAKSLLFHFLCHLPVRGIEPPHLRAQALPVLSPAEEAVGGVGAAHAEGGAGAYRPGRRFRRVLRGVRLVGAEMK